MTHQIDGARPRASSRRSRAPTEVWLFVAACVFLQQSEGSVFRRFGFPTLSVQVTRNVWSLASHFRSDELMVSRVDFERLERRLFQAEKTIQLQASHLQELQATVDALQGHAPSSRAPMPIMRGAGLPVGAPAGFLRERSRTPRPTPPPPSYPTGVPAATYGNEHSGEPFDEARILLVEDFVQENALDTKCRDALLALPAEVQRAVISQGPAEGRNPSAMVMGRIAKAQKDPAFGASAVELTMPPPDGERLHELVESFIAEHNLDERCADTLRNQSPECQEAVLSQGPATGRNASAMVMGRIGKFDSRRI